ncbi:MAG: thioesterase family protein [Desulfobacteraceae bacterium]
MQKSHRDPAGGSGQSLRAGKTGTVALCLVQGPDFRLVLTALYPHGKSYWNPRMQVASLDHAMWYHRDFRMDDWLLYAMESPNAGNARGLNNGRIYTRSGKLVASVAQEGLIRYHSSGGKT